MVIHYSDIFEQDDLTDASDDDVSDDEMEEFFTEENLGYAMKILEVCARARVSVKLYATLSFRNAGAPIFCT